MTEYELQDGWARASLHEVIGSGGLFSDGDWIESKDQDPDGEVRLIQLADVGDDEFRDRSRRFLTKEKAQEIHCTFLEPGDVLIARMPDPLGRACTFPGVSQPAVTAVDVCIVRPDPRGVSPAWLVRAINSPQFRASLEEYERGTTRKRISRSNLGILTLPVPPLAEQRRIAAKVEALLGQVNAGRAHLGAVPAILRRFRQSVLAAACSGQLTEDWRVNHSDRRVLSAPEVVSVEPPESIASVEIPAEWRWIAAGVGYADAAYGTSVRCDATEHGVPVLRVPNIASGRLDLGPMKYAPASTDLHKLILRKGDVLVCRTNGSLDLIGKAAVVQELPRQHAYASYLIRLRVDPQVFVPEYLHLVLMSPLGRTQIEERARTSAGQFNLNLEILRGLAAPRPSVEEQREIVRRVEAVLRFGDTVEQHVSVASARAKKLTQSILARAFRGELVPTEAELAAREGREYEPASVLLERIRKQHEAQSSQPRRHRDPKAAQADRRTKEAAVRPALE
jgi:type I restriction enzyme S subunit